MGKYEKARTVTKAKIVNSFWDLYKQQPLEKITVKKIAEMCGIHRGTFYIHFDDVRSVLEEIESNLLSELNKIEHLYNSTDSLWQYSQILYDCFQEDNKEFLRILVLDRRDPFFSKIYIDRLKEHVFRICVSGSRKDYADHDLSIIDITISSIVDVLLNGICNSSLSIENINYLIIGFMQNGYYTTLSSIFDIKGLRNPFLNV